MVSETGAWTEVFVVGRGTALRNNKVNTDGHKIQGARTHSRGLHGGGLVTAYNALLLRNSLFWSLCGCDRDGLYLTSR
jgi:hypothetical protein